MTDNQFTLDLDLLDGYAFTVTFGDPGVPDLLLDEPAPLGAGRGPNAARLLAAAIGNCLGASLVYCLRRAHIEPQRLHVRVDGALARNDRGRLRVGEIHVKIETEVAPDDRPRFERCLELFEDFCIVTESVRHGVGVTVEVDAAPVATPA